MTKVEGQESTLCVKVIKKGRSQVKHNFSNKIFLVKFVGTQELEAILYGEYTV